MSIRILTGRPQQHTELSAVIYREIGEAIERQRAAEDRGEEKIYLIVPEQYTLGAERALMTTLNQPGLIEADVISLRRLSSRILDTFGGGHHQVVDKQGRLLLLSKAVETIRQDFQVYRKSSHHSGFIANLSDVITELKQNQIALEDLEGILPQIDLNSWTGQKLSELTAVYRQYEVELGESRWDIDAYNRHLCDGIRQSELLHHAKIWMDGFFTFSVNDYAVLEAIAERADEITFSLTGDLDRQVKDEQIFTVCRNTAEKLAEIAARTGHDFHIEKFADSDVLVSPYRILRDEAFAYLQASWPEPTDFIEICHYRDPWQEAVSTAGRISNLVRTKGWHYQDLAILCGSIEARGPMVVRALTDANIPAFCDLPVQIGEDPLIEGFLAAFEAVTENYRATALAVFVQSGYAPLAAEDFYVLENYAMAKGIRGAKWLKSIERSGDEDEWNLEAIEASRACLIEPLKQWAAELKAAQTYRQFLMVSIHFLEEIEAYRKLMALSDRLAASGDFETAGKKRQVWNLLIDLFDRIDQTMGDAACDAATFLQIIRNGLENCRIGVLPNRRDVVQIIDPLRSRGGKIKALLIVGANEGILPAEAPDYPLLSEEERIILSGLGLNLQNDPVFRKSRMDYSLYLQMMRAEELISISACQSDENGDPIRPSSLFAAFRKLFPAVSVQLDERDADWIIGGSGTLDEAVRRLKNAGRSEEEDCRTMAVLDWYRSRPEWQNQVKLGEKAADYHGIQTHDLHPQTIQNLYGSQMTMSVSRIEQFNICPFAHFIHFGLKPKERESFDVHAPEMGTLLHAVIDRCFKVMSEKNLTALDLSEAQCDALVRTVMCDLLAEPKNRVFSDTAANRFLSRKLQRVIRHTFQMIVNHLKKGAFDFKFSEHSFLKPADLPEFAQKVKLRGVIDRIDLYVKDGESYTKIIDYKTGPKEIDFSKIYYGISIQLLLYLQEGLEWLREQIPDILFLPAGAFYFHVDDPLVNEIDPNQLEAKINEAFRMKGLYLNDESVIQAMDSEATDKKSLIFDKKSACGLDADEFQLLLNFVRRQMLDSMRGILSGRIDAEPVRVGSFDPCAYCDCREICQLDALLNRQVFYQTKEKISRDILMNAAASSANTNREYQNAGGILS